MGSLRKTPPEMARDGNFDAVEGLDTGAIKLVPNAHSRRLRGQDAPKKRSNIVSLGAAGLVLFLAGCATTSGDFCDVSSPIRPSAVTLEIMTDAEVAEALAHNEYGRRQCGWRP